MYNFKYLSIALFPLLLVFSGCKERIERSKPPALKEETKVLAPSTGKVKKAPVPRPVNFQELLGQKKTVLLDIQRDGTKEKIVVKRHPSIPDALTYFAIVDSKGQLLYEVQLKGRPFKMRGNYSEKFNSWYFGATIVNDAGAGISDERNFLWDEKVNKIVDYHEYMKRRHPDYPF